MNNLEFAQMALLTDLRDRGKASAQDERRLSELQQKMKSEEIRKNYNPVNQPYERTAEDGAFTQWLRTGHRTGSKETRTVEDGMTTDGADNGSYTVPEGFWQNLQRAMKQYGGLSNDFRVHETPTGNPTPWPTIDPTAEKASVLGADLTQLDLTSPYTFGQGMMQAWTVATSPFLVSLQFLEDSAFDVDQLCTSLIGEQIGRKLADLAVSGTGSNEPLGVLPTITARGEVSTSGGWIQLGAATPVSTFSDLDGSSTTELNANMLSADSYLDLISAIDPAYRDGAKFYVSDDHLKGLRRTVDTLGRPILQNPNDGGVPRLWGYEVVVVPEIPSLQASTVGGPVYANLDVAMVQRVVRSGVRVMRLSERYSEYLAIGFQGFVRVDYRANDVRAMATVKANSS